MKLRFGATSSLSLLLATITVSLAPAALAQHEAGEVKGPSKYLFISNVDLKPNQGGAYAKVESDEVQAQRAAGAPDHYFGMWAITGADHVVFMEGFDSFADMQKDHEARMAMPKLQATIKTDDAAEAPFISEIHTSIYKYDEDLSLRAPLDLAKQRFFRIILFHVRSGRDKDWEHVVKLFAKAYEAIPEAHWAMFEKMYGVGSDNTYILVTPITSLADVDGMVDGGKKFSDSTGEDQLSVLRQQLDADVESSEADIFALGPDISYVPDSWLTASPDFWGKK